MALGFRPTGGGTFHAPQPSCFVVVRLVPFRALAPFAIEYFVLVSTLVVVFRVASLGCGRSVDTALGEPGTGHVCFMYCFRPEARGPYAGVKLAWPQGPIQVLPEVLRLCAACLCTICVRT